MFGFFEQREATPPELPYRVDRLTAEGVGIDPKTVPAEGLCWLKIKDGRASSVCTGQRTGCSGCDYPGAKEGDFCDRLWAGTMWIGESTSINGRGWGDS